MFKSDKNIANTIVRKFGFLYNMLYIRKSVDKIFGY